MATIFCASGGSNTAPYETWAKAATSLQTAITAASDGDVVVLQYDAVPSGDAEVAADTTYTFDAHCSLVSASNGGGSTYTLTAMGAANWIGNSTTNRYIRLAGNDLRVYIWGLTFRVAGSTLDTITPAQGAGSHHVLEDCYFWHSGTATGAVFLLGVATSYCKLINPTFRFGAVGQQISIDGQTEIVGGSVSTDGSAPTTFITSGSSTSRLDWSSGDLTTVTGTLVGNVAASCNFFFHQCKLATGVTPMAAQTSNPTKGSAHVWLLDTAYSANGAEVHGFFGYYDALGQITTDTSVYKTTNTTGNRSWKIVTTANASYRTPFETPPIDVYHTGTSSITPYVEILRDGSATAYKDSEVWLEVAAKTTDYVTQSTAYSDKQAVAAFLAGTAGTNQAAGAGTGEWTGENATAWSGKIDSGSAFTPNANGTITAKVYVAAASSTVYIDPEIRGLS